MSKLRQLRGRLAALQRARLTAKWGTGLAAIGIALLAALAAVFVLDFGFELNIPQRMLIMALALAGFVWGVRKYALPFFQPAEPIEAIALQVEGQHRIESDLIAALQFESPAAPAWGSTVLEERVVARVAETSPRLDVFAGFSRETLFQRVGVLAIMAAIGIVLGLIFPEHFRIFGQRLLLAGVHYPTATVIEQINVGKHVTYERSTGEIHPADVNLPQGRSVPFIVAADGSTPEAGYIKLRDESGRERELVLDRAVSDDARLDELLANSAPERKAKAYYIGELPRLIAPVDYQIYLGDAWTDRAAITMIGLPVLEVEYRITPPRYATAGEERQRTESGTRRLSVLEGSQVEVIARSVNGKQLEQVSLTIHDSTAGEEAEPIQAKFASSGSDSKEWTFADKTSPLGAIDRELQLTINCSDTDGLSLEAPLTCSIRLEADRPPTAAASVVHRVVLPEAAPLVEYRTADDYAISQIKLLVDIERAADDSPNSTTVDEPANTLISSPDDPEEVGQSREQERHVLPIAPTVEGSVISGPWPHGGKYSLDLSPFSLVKGDHIKLTLQVTDFRGEREGETIFSDPLVIEVSDESGVLAAISEADRRSEERLNELIKRQLGIGESP